MCGVVECVYGGGGGCCSNSIYDEDSAACIHLPAELFFDILYFPSVLHRAQLNRNRLIEYNTNLSICVYSYVMYLVIVISHRIYS